MLNTRKGLTRLWLGINVPVALVFGYFAYQAHASEEFWQEQVSYYYERLGSSEYEGVIPPQIKFDEAVVHRDEAGADYVHNLQIAIWVPMWSLYLFVAGTWIARGFQEREARSE